MLKTVQPFFIKDCFSMIVAGSRRSGKSYLIRYLYEKHWKHYDLVIVFTNSISNDFYYEFIPGNQVYAEFKEDVVNKVLAFQEKSHNKLKILFIWDDAVSKKQKSSDVILQLFTRGRHNNCSVIFLTQYPSLCAPEWRENIDYLIILRPKSAKCRLFLIENWLMGYVETPDGQNEKKWYVDLISKNCVDYHCLFIDFISGDEITRFAAK